MAVRNIISIGLFMTALPAAAQEVSTPVSPVVVFQPGTGGTVGQTHYALPAARPMVDCATLETAQRAISYGYYTPETVSPPPQRLEAALFNTALEKYRGYFCAFGRNEGPAHIVVVDFAKHSNEPRLYRVDLRNGDGLDSPIRVAHGIGSDPDDDGYASFFSNVQQSLTSSLGAALGAERYSGINGLSLRLDGLEPSNSQMRARDIVVHSYVPERRRYFNAQHVAARGRPGSSEGCFVVEPDKREWILQTLENGGFLYAGLGGTQPPVRAQISNVIFAAGTGAPTQSAVAPAPVAMEQAVASETPAGMTGSQPITPKSQGLAE